MKTKDPKSYWSLLNKSTDQNKTIVNKVALGSFYDHFKNLNNVNNDNNDFNFNIQNADVNDNFELNKSFSENDIVHAIKSLKNNKSCGNDLILNKFLKCASGKMLSVFCKLFNIVLHQVLYLVAGLRELFALFTRIKGMPTTLIITKA